MYRYPGAHHWFVEENQPDYYDAEATELAWARTIAFLATALAA
jgi:dienelactone hydrolase